MPSALPLVFAALAATPPSLPHYDMTFDAEHERMAVRLCVPDATDALALLADDGAAKFATSIVRESGRAVRTAEDGWIAPDWKAGECLRYDADLGKLADTFKPDSGLRVGRHLVGSPGLWLLQPDGYATYSADVHLPAGWTVSAPWHARDASAGTQSFEIPRTPVSWSSLVALGRFAETRMPLPGGVLRIAVLAQGSDAELARLHAWFARVSRAALTASGRLPVPDVQVLMLPKFWPSTAAVAFGESQRGQGHSLILFVDPTRPESAFAHDWIAVHELSHLFHPYLGDRGAWLAEGLATYWQNVLRARAGLLTPAQAWDEIGDGFARGRARTPSGTLEDAARDMHARHDFMRVYWAGTAYWLDVDTELRRASGGALSVDEAMQRFGACCRPTYRRWEPEEFVAKLDALLGTDVFARRFEAYRRMRAFPDIDAQFRALGVIRGADGTIRLDAAAPDATARDAIMAPRKPSS